MTLEQTIRIIEQVAKAQPAIKTVVENDIYRLNSLPDVKYGVFAFLQNQHSADIDSDLITYNFTLFYVDRLTADKGNKINVQSTGVAVLNNIIRTLADKFGILATGGYSFQPFNQRFTDECAGVYTNVALQVEIDSICEETEENWEAKEPLKLMVYTAESDIDEAVKQADMKVTFEAFEEYWRANGGELEEWIDFPLPNDMISEVIELRRYNAVKWWQTTRMTAQDIGTGTARIKGFGFGDNTVEKMLVREINLSTGVTTYTFTNL